MNVNCHFSLSLSQWVSVFVETAPPLQEGVHGLTWQASHACGHMQHSTVLCIKITCAPCPPLVVQVELYDVPCAEVELNKKSKRTGLPLKRRSAVDDLPDVEVPLWVSSQNTKHHLPCQPDFIGGSSEESGALHC